MEKEYYIIKIKRLNMMVILLMVNLKGMMKNIFMKMEIIISGHLKKVKGKVKEKYFIKTVELNMKVILLMDSMKEMEDIIMKMEIIILGNLEKAKNMEMEHYIIRIKK